jgi:glutamine synthetase
MKTKSVPEIFGSMVFNEQVMQSRLPKNICKALKKTMQQGIHLELDLANVVANAMKDWAVEKGATHFTHWFHPMTGITAEKRESFISPGGEGKVIMEFSGKELVRGEPDASSFPSGGLRCTFEARGYTVWDITSYAFIKDNTLFIPTAFCSYSGESLDSKTPLLRSVEALNAQALRIMSLFGNTKTQRVNPTVGAEQEYFLIDKSVYLRRPDLLYTGRTLLGARPAKGQELDDHYFGSIKPRVSAFMEELETELWKLGVYAKTKHDEVAPGQHEMAPVFTTTNIACDHNHLTMDLMKTIADKHGLACLLHEKPFAGLNGSGKHNNWSLSTDDGENLLEPGDTPHRNAQFLLFLVAVIKAVDTHAELLRATVASAGNDHRLGANEAPPAIVSMFLGDELTAVLDAIEEGVEYEGAGNTTMEVGVTALPHFPRDNTDRNRTSPFAFTGNKFEFRMPGASFSIAESNVVINTAVADVLCGFADALEGADNFKDALNALIKKTIADHKRIIFGGNGYTAEWEEMANKRGLPNAKTTPQALPALVSPASTALFARHGVFTETELQSRRAIHTENYEKTIAIEANTMKSMVNKGIFPACIAYQNELAKLLKRKKQCGEFSTALEEHLLGKISNLAADLLQKLAALEAATTPAEQIAAMTALRETSDALETITARKHWPFPSYGELLYSIY